MREREREAAGLGLGKREKQQRVGGVGFSLFSGQGRRVAVELPSCAELIGMCGGGKRLLRLSV
jgi:hypothetical protein